MLIVPGLISIAAYSQTGTDTTKAWNLYRPQHQVNKDSIDARQKLVQDSILAREKFVRDSIQHRKQVLDSLTFLQTELQTLLQAVQWTTNEDIISHADKISIIGDTVLGDFVYYKLPLTLYGPYTPWKGSFSLNARQVRFTIDKKTNKIGTIQGPSLTCGFNYANQGMIIVIREDYTLQKNSYGNFFKFPVDSIFFDRNKKIVKVKRYVQFYNLLPTNRKGELLFTNLSQVKQYQYDTNGQMTKYELVKFCDRYKAYDKNEVCSIINYAVAKQNNNYLITRRNNPENEYSDGTFTLEFDAHENIKSISFRLLNNALMWQRFVEMNKDGNVSCYTDKKSGITTSTQCMVYHKEPNAKYPVEVITTTFDKDGIDYMQTNVTTEKSRLRNKLTLEWGPWK
jgi:hypothetical protein